MKFLITQVFIVIVISAGSGSAILAQSNPDPEFSVRGTVQGTFDRFEGNATIELRNMIVSEKLDGGTSRLALNVIGQYSGSPAPPPTVRMIFQTTSLLGNRYRPGQPVILNVIADNETFKFQLAALGVDRFALNLFVDTVGAVVPYSEFKKIARARNVEMRFDGIEFSLSDEQSATFHEFLKRFWDDK